MDKLDAIRTFVRVVERRSFALAAQDLAIPRSRASEIVQRLERHLGIRLLARTTRQVFPTAEGEEYYARCRTILADMDAADQAVTASVPGGPLRINVHGTFARHFLLPEIPVFLNLYPGIQLHVGESDRFVDLVTEGIDCVIRVGEPEENGLICRRLGTLTEGTFASPAYLEKRGVPSSPEDLEGHQMIAFMSTKTRAIIPLEFSCSSGVKIINAPINVTVNAAESMVVLGIMGLGLIQVPKYRLADELSAGSIVEVLQDYRPVPSPVYILHPHNRHVSSRARAFMDWVVPVLTDKLLTEK